MDWGDDRAVWNVECVVDPASRGTSLTWLAACLAIWMLSLAWTRVLESAPELGADPYGRMLVSPFAFYRAGDDDQAPSD